MAGDWIKMRTNLWDDPRVSRLCDLTDQPEAMVVGGLYWLWAMADEHTEDGILEGLTLRAIDRKTGIQGFGDALADVGWLADHPEGVRIVGFEEHNGKSAKRRASDSKRKDGVRNSSEDDPQPVRSLSACDAETLRSDCGGNVELEKRREEKNSSSLRSEESGTPQSVAPPPDYLGDANESEIPTRAVVKLADAWELPESWGLDAEKLGWEPAQILKESEKFRQHWVSGKGKGTRRSLKGWKQTWSNWLSNAERYSQLRRVV